MTRYVEHAAFESKASSMYPVSDELFGMVSEILWSAWKAKACREGKTEEAVVREAVVHAARLGARIDVDAEVRRVMANRKGAPA